MEEEGDDHVGNQWYMVWQCFTRLWTPQWLLGFSWSFQCTSEGACLTCKLHQQEENPVYFVKPCYKGHFVHGHARPPNYIAHAVSGS